MIDLVMTALLETCSNRCWYAIAVAAPTLLGFLVISRRIQSRHLEGSNSGTVRVVSRA